MIPRMTGQEASELGTKTWTVARLCKIRKHSLRSTAAPDMTSLIKTYLSRMLFSRKTKSRSTIATSSKVEGRERCNGQTNIFSLHGSTATGKFWFQHTNTDICGLNQRGEAHPPPLPAEFRCSAWGVITPKWANEWWAAPFSPPVTGRLLHMGTVYV